MNGNGPVTKPMKIKFTIDIEIEFENLHMPSSEARKLLKIDFRDLNEKRADYWKETFK